MLRLIKADLSPTRKLHLRNGTPSLFLNVGALNALLCQGSHFNFQIVTHEIEFVSGIVGRVDCGFCWRQGEDQPAMTGIYKLETEDIAKKCAVPFCVLTVENYVSARDHLSLRRTAGNRFYMPGNFIPAILRAKLGLPICLNIFFICAYWRSRLFTSCTLVPEPRAMRLRRLPLITS
jgi:hypothetical protein